MTENQPHPRSTQQYQHIVVPTDGSDGADFAANHAVTLAEALDATVHVISVVEDSWANQQDKLRSPPAEQAEEAVATISNQAADRDVPVETTTRSGTPAQTILMFAQEQDADLIVMSTHGRTGLQHVVFGSIAEDIVRKSEIPVMTVRPPEWED